MNNIIYMDNHATTPIAPEVLEAMMPYLTTHFGNASSTHAFGTTAKDAVERHASKSLNSLDARQRRLSSPVARLNRTTSLSGALLTRVETRETTLSQAEPNTTQSSIPATP